MSVTTLADQAQRDAFIQNIRGSYSVVAPAGVGKTESITRRITHLALLSKIDSDFDLSKLVVATYTKAAAAEMQERARQALQKQGHSAEVMSQFNRGFFGTIHSFCGSIVREWGPRVGVRSDFEVETQSDTLFLEFMRAESDLTRFIPDEAREDFKRLMDIWKVLECLRNPDALKHRPKGAPPAQKPEIDLSPLLDAKLKRASAKLDQYKVDLRDWLERYDSGDGFVGLPKKYDSKNESIEAAFETVFGELFAWVSQVALAWLFEVDQAFFEYRCRNGRLFFSDTVRIVNLLLEDQEVADTFYEKNYYVILDEAQDTDPDQFRMLLGMCGVYQVEPGSCIVKDRTRFAQGRWCMVGDFQQSIYKSRADISVYQKIHDTLVEEGLIEPLVFNVTFRCDHAIVDWVNQFMDPVFKQAGSEQKIAFVPLVARNDATLGLVERLSVPPGEKGEKLDVVEARAIAEKLAEAGESGLGIDDWSECAILCPRRLQLAALETEFTKVGIAVQKQSDTRTYRMLPQYAWPVALLKVICDPGDSFEIASVLREFFGLKDELIYRFLHQASQYADSLPDAESVFQLKMGVPVGGEVPDVLNLLIQMRRGFFETHHAAAVTDLFAKVELEKRLEIASPYEVPEKIYAAVEQVRLEILKAYEKFGDWGSVLEYLETVFLEQEISAGDPKPGHVQLLTCHKSKGLQWKVVILPFMSRSISKPPVDYPRMVNTANPAETVFMASASDPSKAPVMLMEQESIDESRRLLYVAATRAKHRLIFVADEGAELFKPSAKGFPGFAQLLSASLPHPLDGLPEFSGSVGVVEASTGVKALEDDASLPTPVLEWEQPHVAFLQRKLPSMLGHGDPDPSNEAKVEADEVSEVTERGPSLAAQQGAAYGTWWHESLETLWLNYPHGLPDELDWRSFAFWETCPDCDRAEDELNALVKHSGLQNLFKNGFSAVAELPLVWKDPEGDVIYDGYIDCVLRHADSGDWCLIDWKTDAVNAFSGLEELSERYHEQIGVYKRALTDIWDRPGKAYLYSTRLADWSEV